MTGAARRGARSATGADAARPDVTRIANIAEEQ